MLTLSLVVASGGYSVVVFRLLVVVAFLVEGAQASVVEVHKLSCSMVCGIFLDNVPNPCLLHWQVDSSPVGHLGSPSSILVT